MNPADSSGTENFDRPGTLQRPLRKEVPCLKRNDLTTSGKSSLAQARIDLCDGIEFRWEAALLALEPLLYELLSLRRKAALSKATKVIELQMPCLQTAGLSVTPTVPR